MKITAEEIRAGDLEPGDLFSTFGPAYWDEAVNGTEKDGLRSVGEKLFVRTTAPALEHADPDAMVFRITIDREKMYRVDSSGNRFDLHDRNAGCEAEGCLPAEPTP